MATIGDVFRVYVKDSLDGRMIIRKKTTKQTSARLEARKDKLRALRGTGNAPSQRCHDQLVAAGKCPTKRVYEPGVGYTERPVCPIKEMAACLSEVMKSI